MIDVFYTDNLDHPDLLKFKTRREAEVEPFNEIIIDSERVVRRAVDCGVKIKILLVTNEYFERSKEWISSLKGARVYVAKRQLIEVFVGQRVHQCMMAVGERPTGADLSKAGSRVVFLNGINDAQNVGAIVRNCHAFGVDTVMIDEFACSPFARRSIRVSMGSVFWLKFIICKSGVSDLLALKSNGYKVISSHLRNDSVDLNSFSFPAKSVLVVGNEFEGVSKDVESASDAFVKIPIASTVDSLNAACASAVLIHAMMKNP